MCWAAARAYAPELLTHHVQALAASLLTTACYDREVNCRRAAAAAFQECVGRLGSFPHGIALMTITDYFSVGSLNSTYLQVSSLMQARKCCCCVARYGTMIAGSFAAGWGNTFMLLIADRLMPGTLVFGALLAWGAHQSDSTTVCAPACRWPPRWRRSLSTSSPLRSTCWAAG